MFLSGFTFAQEYPTDKGSKILFGNILFSSMGGYLYEDSDENRATTIQTTPSISFFVTPGLSLGGKGNGEIVRECLIFVEEIERWTT